MSDPIQPSELNAMLAATSEYPQFFTDNLQLTTGPYSVNLVFGLLDTNNVAHPVASVRMSPHHAKVMARVLQKQIDAYEKNIGPLVLPSALLKELGIEENEQ
jgi:hypothetical protein